MKIALINLTLLTILIFTSCSSNEKTLATENFKNHTDEIESIIKIFRHKELLTYIEFNENNTIDLSIVDPQKDNNSGEVNFEFDLHGQSVESGEIKRALSYASTSLKEVKSLREKLKNINCISFSRPYRPNKLIDFEIGHKRSGWSKWYYVKLKDEVNINEFIEKYKKENYTKLNNHWFLNLESPR